MAEQDDDRESVDRAFAELVAGYHLTAEHPAEPRLALGLSGDLATTDDRADTGDATEPAPPPVIPLVPPRPELVQPLAWRASPAPAPTPDERYVPDPLPPLGRPRTPALVGWTAVLLSAVVVLAAGFGLRLPTWLGYLAVTCFIVGSVVLLTQLPRHRPPDAGDGAVL
ncbi:hypothetical protein [Microlunatus antarcticus]|uniref:Uncharacterized protein n=1 Tax=Microlunatus antarcticus TaxID=53388 RepID=A0A7W5JY54_9ACTN|nr:hypothetical protein [Microlunatus antarcticus]MBB3328330.1 hypothetical protein [Microlunatus antarcticus]